MSESFDGKRVVVMGLGRFGGGVGVTRWLCAQGAEVVVTDLAEADELAESLAQLAGLDVEYRLGGHEGVDIAAAELLVVNPAVPFNAPLIGAATRHGASVTTEINLFMSRCPAPMVGVTGSVGKSTTCAMAQAILARRFKTHLGGNIGKSLLPELTAIEPEHVVVLELSSFQLAYLPAVAISPGVALVTNLLANHLDRHGTLDHYARCKQNLYRWQRGDDVLIVNADDPATRGWADEAPARTDRFALADPPFELNLPGRHNQANAQAAWAIARQFGIDRDDAAEALRAQEPLADRLQRVGEKNGVAFYNDSKATTPEGAIVALGSFEAGSIVAIVGGYDKQAPLSQLCETLAARCAAVVCTGQTGPAIAAGVRAAGGATVVEAPRFDQAVTRACEIAQPGQVVLLSPGCASYDAFANYQKRGQRFAELTGAAGPS